MKTVVALVSGLIIGAAGFYLAQPMLETEADPEAVLRFNDKNYTLEDLPLPATLALYDMDMDSWQRKRSMLTSSVAEIYVQEKSRETGKGREETLKEILDLQTPTDAEIVAFYEQNKARIPAPLEQVRAQINNYLMGEQVQSKRDQLVEKLKADLGLEILIPEPAAPMTVIASDGYPAKGSDKPVLTIVKFADYQCPHCKVASNTLKRIMAEHGDQLRLIYMDFPINSSGISRGVAKGGVCADEQGRFWDYNGAAYDVQSSLNDNSSMGLAEQLELNIDSFRSCMDSDRPELKVKASEQEAERLGITGTPALFVNGRKINPSDLEAGLETEIKRLLNQKK